MTSIISIILTAGFGFSIFYRIQKLALKANSSTQDQATKYLARIVTDILLITRDLTYEDMHRLHYSDIIQTAVFKTSIFSEVQKGIITEYFRQPDITQQCKSEVTNILHKIFTILLTRHYDKYLHNN